MVLTSAIESVEPKGCSIYGWLCVRVESRKELLRAQNACHCRGRSLIRLAVTRLVVDTVEHEKLAARHDVFGSWTRETRARRLEREEKWARQREGLSVCVMGFMQHTASPLKARCGECRDWKVRVERIQVLFQLLQKLTSLKLLAGTRSSRLVHAPLSDRETDERSRDTGPSSVDWYGVFELSDIHRDCMKDAQVSKGKGRYKARIGRG